MKSIKGNNIEWGNPTAHAICSYIESSGYASGPIRRCLFIDYIIIRLSISKIVSMIRKYHNH